MNLNHFEDFAIVEHGAIALTNESHARGWRIVCSILGKGVGVDRYLMGRLANPYRGYSISYDPPPVPGRQFDWQYVHKDYDGAEDAGDNRAGSAASWDACLSEIDDLEDD